MSEDRYFHHDHPLVCRTDLGDDVKEEDVCSKCKREIGKFSRFLKCSECHFFIHLECINQYFYPGSFQPYKTFTFHFSHEHPLVLIEEPENDGTEKLVTCSGCEEQILGPGFKCFYSEYCKYFYSDYCKYFLHKSCTELAHEIQHPLHPDHHMTLVTRREALHTCSCDACGKHCSGSFFYKCCDCQGLGLDIKCASRWPTSKDDYHQHSFFPFPKQIQFACDNCGEEREDCRLMICGICRLLIHTTCDGFPRTIKIIFHHHLLTLTYYLHQVEERADILCEVCRRPVKKNYAGYYCQKCNYGTVHLECATTWKNWRATKESVFEHSIKYITELIDDANLAEKERGRPREIQHFSHEHDLILNDEDEEVKDDKLCDGCMHLISVPFYSCTQCNFFLHHKCAKLPKQATHRRLSFMGVFTLLPQPLSSDGVFLCGLCRRYRRGFVYSSEVDVKDVMVDVICFDVICFAIEDVLRTYGHQHPLLLASGGIGQECKACGELDDFRECYFVCPNQNCNFTLGFECATLPSKARHRYDDHLLTLTFTAEDDTGEYYCLICEEERDPNHWFYYCAKCEFAAHHQCVLGKHPFIKPGKTYKDENHEHPVTFVRKTEYSPPCGGCGSHFINEIALECVQCELSFHAEFNFKPDFPRHRIDDHPCLRNFDKYKKQCTISNQVEDSIE